MNAGYQFSGRNAAPLWSNRLWFLAAALGVTTIYFSAATIHDNSRGRAAVHMVAESMAGHVSALAAARLEVLAGPTFAPAAQNSGAAPAALAALVQAQRHGETCACRDVLPAVAFFRVDPVTHAIAVAHVSSGSDTAFIPAAALSEFASKPHGPQGVDSRVQLRSDRAFGQYSIVTYADDDSSRSRIAMYGLIARTDALMRTLFRHDMSVGAAGDPGLGIARLDTLSLHVATMDSAAKFGTLSADRPYRATVHGRGAFNGVAVTVALKPSQVEMPLMVAMPHERVWRIGVLLLCTIVVIVIAVGSSRRELLLARARSDFVAGVSHDLRMPLAQVLLAGETLALDRVKGDAERRAMASSIVREARRLTALVDNVLLFSRAGAVAPKPNLQRVDIAELFGEVVDAVQLAVQDAGQSIEAREHGGLAVHADHMLVRQALVNLVDNALKYGKAGQCVRLSAAASSAHRVVLRVDDEGPGIPRDQRTRVFEAYERLDHDQVSERTGTGLGLAVVRQIARVCGGDARIEDAPGGGTRAVLELNAAPQS